MPFQTTRPYGPYTELLLIARKAFEQKHGCEIVVDESCKIGVPIWRDAGLSFGNYKMFYCHPVDYIWACLGKDIFFADQVAQHWIQWNIHRRAEQAEARLERKLAAMNQGGWSKWSETLRDTFGVTGEFLRAFGDSKIYGAGVVLPVQNRGVAGGNRQEIGVRRGRS